MDVERELHVEPQRDELARGDRFAVLAALATPSYWLLQLSLAQSLVGWMCANGQEWPLHALTAGGLAVATWAGLHCWRRRHPDGPPPGEPGVAPWAQPTPQARRAVARAGVALAAFFALLVLGVEIPGLILEPCS